MNSMSFFQDELYKYKIKASDVKRKVQRANMNVAAELIFSRYKFERALKKEKNKFNGANVQELL